MGILNLKSGSPGAIKRGYCLCCLLKSGDILEQITPFPLSQKWGYLLSFSVTTCSACHSKKTITPFCKKMSWFWYLCTPTYLSVQHHGVYDIHCQSWKLMEECVTLKSFTPDSRVYGIQFFCARDLNDRSRSALSILVGSFSVATINFSPRAIFVCHSRSSAVLQEILRSLVRNVEL